MVVYGGTLRAGQLSINPEAALSLDRTVYDV